jgi:hypothetical protein
VPVREYLVFENLVACPCITDQPIRRKVKALPPFRRLLYLFIVHLNFLSSSALLTSVIPFCPSPRISPKIPDILIGTKEALTNPMRSLSLAVSKAAAASDGSFVSHKPRPVHATHRLPGKLNLLADELFVSNASSLGSMPSRKWTERRIG